jgi:hypothetical protein
MTTKSYAHIGETSGDELKNFSRHHQITTLIVIYLFNLIDDSTCFDMKYHEGRSIN